MMTTSDIAAQQHSAITQCRVCHSDVPSGAFCGHCGAHLYQLPGNGPDQLRARAYAAEPAEQLLRLSVVTTLFPDLLPRSRTAFRVALGLLVVALVVLALLRWQAALIAVSAFGLPVLFVTYQQQTGTRGDLGLRAVALTSVIGLTLGVAWALLTGPLLANSYLRMFGPGHAGARLIGQGLSIPVIGAILMIVPVVLARVFWPASRESLDGYLLGARAALFYTAGAIAVRGTPQLANGLVAHHKPVNVLLEQAGVQGFAMPVTAAAVGGLAGVALWFTPRATPQRGPASRPVIAALAFAVLIYAVLGIVDVANLTPAVQLGLHLVVAGIALLTLRIGVHLGLLHEQQDNTRGEPALCFHCRHVVPDMAFCPNCGAAAHAASRTARSARHAVAEASAGAPAGLFPGYGVPPGSYSAPLPHSTSPGRLILITGAVLAVAVAVVSAVSVKTTPALVHYACPPDCGRPPIGPPVGGKPGQAPGAEPPAPPQPPSAPPVAVKTFPRFTSKDGAFSVAYLPAANVRKKDDGITLTFDDMDGEIRLFGTSANNRTPRQIVEQYIQKNYRTAQTAYQIPNAMVGYEPGYGEVDDFSLEDPNAASTRGRLLVMTAVRNGLALVAVAEGPMIRFTPKTSPHPSAVNLMIAQLLGNSVNSFTWNKPASS